MTKVLEPHPNNFFKAHWMAIAGGTLSAAYLTGWGAYAYYYWPCFAAMKPNEWGDAFAGFSAGLAFLWLVLGFFQQGQELRHQIEELRHTVKAGQDQAKSQELSAATSHAHVILEIQKEAALQNRTLLWTYCLD